MEIRIKGLSLVNVQLTSAWPPLVGGNARCIQHKLIRLPIVVGASLQATQVGTMSQLRLGIGDGYFEAFHPLAELFVLFGCALILQSVNYHHEHHGEGVSHFVQTPQLGRIIQRTAIYREAIRRELALRELHLLTANIRCRQDFALPAAVAAFSPH